MDFSWLFYPDLGKPCVLHYLRRNALKKPQTRCSSGPCLPGLREQRRSHKHSGCVHRLPPLLLLVSRPRLSLKTPSHRYWRSHFAATCDSQSCESPLNKKRDVSLLQQVFIWIFCPHYFFSLLSLQHIINMLHKLFYFIFLLNLSLKSHLELLKCGFTNYVWPLCRRAVDRILFREGRSGPLASER